MRCLVDCPDGFDWRYNMRGVFFWGWSKILSAAVGVEMQKKFLDHPQKTILITY
jgi:hypothetical protein